MQWVKSSVLNDAHIDKWMAHPLLLLLLRPSALPASSLRAEPSYAKDFRLSVTPVYLCS